ncbi:unnamed protein product [Lactuca virosa]|uniref:Uncharacterized protein n=1 Tax=Lactuca virosa TaxID=75947 RepID=A0AAU9N0U9_9ASTR|nr:unnamed protein product [Lactuca virosa]
MPPTLLEPNTLKQRNRNFIATIFTSATQLRNLKRTLSLPESVFLFCKREVHPRNQLAMRLRRQCQAFLIFGKLMEVN